MILARLPKISTHSAVVTISACLLLSCDRVQNLSRETETLPTVRTLTDTTGREVLARVTFRESNHISFVRLADNRNFRLAIAELSESDANWARSLAISTTSFTSEPAAEEVAPERLSFHDAEIQRLETEIAEIRQTLRVLPGNTMKWKSEYSRMERLKNRLARLQKNTL